MRDWGGGGIKRRIGQIFLVGSEGGGVIEEVICELRFLRQIGVY